MTQTRYGSCNLCEAICGLEYTVDDGRVTSIRGDEQDPLSRGHICPKALALVDVHADPDRLRRPVKRVGDQWQEIGWDEAFDLVAERLAAIRKQHGDNAVGVYLGNPNVHNYGSLTHGLTLLRELGTRNRFSATSVDQLPHQMISYLMYGHQLLLPIPDIDRTSYFLVFGANPLASNGSLMTVPDVRKRLDDLRKRDGKLVVFDPRRTETAVRADEHHFIRPGVSTQRFGVLCQWAIQLLNIVTGNLDRVGGTMITHPAADLIGAGVAGRGHYGKWHSRVRGLPEFGGELPVAALAEEIATPGDGQIKALLTVAGNPVLSTPNGPQLEGALDGLEFMVAIDIYLNETTRHADVILPPTVALEHDNYDLAFHALAVRNTARYSPAILKPSPGAKHDWQIVGELVRRRSEI